MIDVEMIPKGAKVVLDMLHKNGFKAYLVGGCIRDLMMNQTPKDWDICTSAFPVIVQDIFKSRYTVLETGMKHGTVTVMVDGDGFEVTTYRVDGKYSDGRRPDTITFTPSLKDDLARRDFTMNALAYNPTDGVKDYYGGIADMEQGLIRCVGLAKDRFQEDSLRILRALRFSATKGFRIEAETEKAIRDMYPMMSILSAERIFSEISKLLQGEYAYDVLRDYSEVFTFLIPELAPMLGCLQNNPHHKYDVWEHTCRVVDWVSKDEVLRFAALFHDAGKPVAKATEDGIDHFHLHAMESVRITEQVLCRLKSSNDLIEKVTTLVKYHDAELPNKASVKRLLNKIGPESVKQLLILKEADTMSQSEYCRESKLRAIQTVEQLLSELETEQACFTLKDLDIHGDDLMQIGIPQGKVIGKILNQLLSEVMDEVIENHKDVLLPRAIQIREQLEQI